MLEALLFIVGLVLLLDGATVFLRAAINITENLRLPRALVASVILALGTSLPEISIAISSLINAEVNLSLGNVLGSNITNIFLVLPLSILAVKTFHVGNEELRDNAHLLILASFLFLVLINQGYKPIYGLASLAVAGALIYYQTVKKFSRQEITEQKREYPNFFIVLMGIMGLIGLIIGSQVLVSSAQNLAMSFGISEFFIGLLIVSTGTVLPELATSIAAIRSHEFRIAAGNLVNSNLFNILLVGGIGGLSGQFIDSQQFIISAMFVLSGVVAFGLLRFYSRRSVPLLLSLTLIGIYIFYVVNVITKA